ncbi:MAG: isochorismatase family protein [bacterium]|nr:isochorismatase family protein [bacterium]
MKKALLVIDISHGDGWYSSIEKLDEDRKQVALPIKQTLEEWRASNGLIVFIVMVALQNPPLTPAQVTVDRKRSGCIICDLPAHQRLAGFLKHRHRAGFEPAFTKYRSNAFTNSELVNFLRSEGVTEVVLAGCNTFSCMLKTAQGAIENGFDVTLLEHCTYPIFSSDNEKRQWIEESLEDVMDIARVSVTIAQSV